LFYGLAWWHAHDKSLPTIEQVKNVWEIDDPDKCPYDQQDLLLWYVDQYLPEFARDFYGPNHRYYHLLSEKSKCGKFERTAVSPSMEGFAIAAYENNHAKWKAQFEFLDENPGKKLPKGAGNEAYTEGKFSSSKRGQVKYGGWNDEGLATYSSYADYVEKMREEDEQNGYAKQKLALNLMRVHHNKSADSAELEGNKRKRTSKKTSEELVITPKQKKIARKRDE
jgi:hypothetical protein